MSETPAEVMTVRAPRVGAGVVAACVTAAATMTLLQALDGELVQAGAFAFVGLMTAYLLVERCLTSLELRSGTLTLNRPLRPARTIAVGDLVEVRWSGRWIDLVVREGGPLSVIVSRADALALFAALRPRVAPSAAPSIDSAIAELGG